MNKEQYYGFSIIVRGSKTFLDFRKPNNNFFFRKQYCAKEMVDGIYVSGY